jgi:hypothetical protein
LKDKPAEKLLKYPMAEGNLEEILEPDLKIHLGLTYMLSFDLPQLLSVRKKIFKISFNNVNALNAYVEKCKNLEGFEKYKDDP